MTTFMKLLYPDMKKGESRRLVFFVSEDWYFCSHRLGLALEAQRNGYKVFLVCNTTGQKYTKMIENAGIELIPISINRSDTGIFTNINTMLTLYRIFKRIGPNIVHNVAQKPIILGTIVSKMLGVRSVINAFGGLGYVFSSETLKARVLRCILRLVYKGLLTKANVRLIVQNETDYFYFSDEIGCEAKRIYLIKGAGVDTEKYNYSPATNNGRGNITVVMLARLLRDKGVYEFCNAAKMTKAVQPDIEFLIAGDIDPKNPNSLTPHQVTELVATCGVNYVGQIEDVATLLIDSDIAILPSYREGMPKSLLEAAAIGRPIITTDVPGCRDVVCHGINGYLVPAYDSNELASRVIELANNPQLRIKMGKFSRELAEKEFCHNKINKTVLAIYNNTFDRDHDGKA